MKVLFAVNNESISESIIKSYQQTYKEIISAKNVYYFNAIIKELQRDKTYDRIVISEDLEPFANNHYEAIDKFIFEKMDSISDEATNNTGNDIPIILICADRRTKEEPLLVKLFGIGVYSALLGSDRSVTNVCDLINKPRTKKEAKIYYHIDPDDVDYKVENEGDVSEVEIQNILNHYKRLGRNEEKYVESFDKIAEQYTDAQLRLIIKFLPLNVKAVLEANSKKYQEMITFGTNTTGKATRTISNTYEPTKVRKENKKKMKEKKEESGLELIEKNLSRNKLTEPVIIPSSINKVSQRPTVEKVAPVAPIVPAPAEEKVQEELPPLENPLDDFMDVSFESEPVQEEQEPVTVTPKRRGRPKKVKAIPEEQEVQTEEQPKRRGRPRKVGPELAQRETENIATASIEEQETSVTSPVNLFELGEEDTQATPTSYQNDMILPGFDEEEEEDVTTQESESTILPGFEEESIEETPFYQPPTPFGQAEQQQTQEVEKTQYDNRMNIGLESLLTRDKKVVAFVGTSKNGTSFLVNNLAELLSEQGINTAILDLTKNKNAYYIYTENEESLRAKAYGCIENLKKGVPEGIQVHKNLTVYTTLPGEDNSINDYANILETLVKNYSLVLLDCDFDTNYGYFKEAQELYLVQSMDVLTIQPLTAFLRELKAKNILNPEKIRVVVNKMIKVRSVSEKTIIGGMAFYNDPAMSFMTELFNKDTVSYTVIPFEEQTYSRYLEGLINCKITLNGYSKSLIAALTQLGNMVYPLIASSNFGKKNNGYSYQPPTSNAFSSNINDTLNRMKNNY